MSNVTATISRHDQDRGSHNKITMVVVAAVVVVVVIDRTGFGWLRKHEV